MAHTGTALVESVVVVQDAAREIAGCVSYWSLSGNVQEDALRTAWLAEGLDEQQLPTLPSPRVALQRAVEDLRERRLLIRQVQGGWAFVREREVSGYLDYEQVGAVRFDTLFRLVFVEGTPDKVRSYVEGQFRSNLHVLTHGDIGSWITGQAERLHGVALRPTGGVWFIPRDSAEEWRRIASALRAASAHAIYEIPALPTKSAVEAILDAVSREAADEAKKIEEELASGELGVRAMETRTACAEAMERKLAKYEELLGRSLSDLTDRLETIRGNLAVAILAAEAKKAKQEQQ